MKIKPIITEKTTELAKSGKYTFKFAAKTTKNEIKKLIGKLFAVDVVGVRTISLHGEVKKTMSRRKKVVKPSKKAVVWLKEKQTIDIFETKKGKKK
jgi:large subunit ribosomal protein L23